MTLSADFAYPVAADAAGVPVNVSVFSDRSVFRDRLTDQLAETGFRVLHCGEVAGLVDGTLALLGDAVLLDCPVIDARGMAALARLDMRIARSGAQLVVTTSLAALDDAFVCFDQSAPQILVDPAPAELVVALGNALGRLGTSGVRELSQDDRAALLQLSAQVEALERRREEWPTPVARGEDGGNELASSKSVFRGFDTALAGEPLALSALPDPRLVRDLIRRRQARARYFEGALFADPAWDMLLDLTAAAGEKVKVSVTSLCIASGVPATTALRWVRHMIDAGLFVRTEDRVDKRRAFISLSDAALAAMSRYFAEVEHSPLARAA
ncbi:MAG: MarR family transcriptional regulator [Erythrobacter sp.]